MTSKSYHRLKGESEKMYKRFTTYMDIAPEERTVKKAAELIFKEECPELSNSEDCEEEFKKLFAAVTKNSTRWHWIERAKIRDAEKLLEQQQESKKDFDKTTNDLKETFKRTINYCNDLLTELIDNDNGYSLVTRIRMIGDLTNTLGKAQEQYRLACGYSTTNNDVNINGAIDVANTVSISDFVSDSKALEIIKDAKYD